MDGFHSKNYPKKAYNCDRRVYLKEIIKKLEKPDISKIYLTTAINFVSSKGTDQKCKIHSKNDKVELISFDKVDKVSK